MEMGLLYLDQIIFNAIKQSLKACFVFPGSYYIMSYCTQALDIAGQEFNQDIL